MALMLRNAPGASAFLSSLFRSLAGLATVVTLCACAPQNVRDDGPAPSSAEAARRAALLEPGPAPPELTAPGDELVLERLRERAAARRTAAARLKLDDGAPSFDDLWARIRAGLALPRVEHPAITAELDWYASRPDYLQRTTDRARLYLAHIVHEAERRKLPLELSMLPIVESAFQPYARSPAGAMGIWQFIRSTGRRFGLEQTAWYDGRRDIVESTRAAFDYLERLYSDLDGDWLLAVAAYNAGEGNVLRARQRNRAEGKPEDFFSLDLPAETRAYVPRLLAITELVRAPSRHGITLDPIDDAPYFRSVAVNGQIDLSRAAEMAGITLNEMMLLNPGFSRHATDPRGPHRLLVPEEAASAFSLALATTDTNELTRWEVHRVSSGDTLSGIAGRYGVSVDQIASANDMDGTLLRVGQELKVPGGMPPEVTAALSPEVRRGMERARRYDEQRVYRVRTGDSLWSIARRNEVSVGKLRHWNGLGRKSLLRPGQKLVIRTATAAPPAPATAVRRSVAASGERATHVVRSGESLWHIARRYRVSTDDLARWNGITTTALLHPGQRLRVTPPQSV